VRDLLDLGQLERSGFSIATEPVDLATVAERGTSGSPAGPESWA
jgi:hypothetical protein